MIKGFYLLLVAGATASCCPNENPIDACFSLETFEAQNWSGGNQTDAESVNNSNYLIVLNLTTTNGKEIEYFNERRGFLWPPDCSEPFLNVDLAPKVIDLQIFTENDLINGFPVGSDVTTLFSSLYIDKNPLLDEPEVFQFNPDRVEDLNTLLVENTTVEQIANSEPFRYYGLKPTFQVNEPSPLNLELF